MRGKGGELAAGGRSAADSSARWGRRIWRYGPLALWMAFIFYASTNSFSASNTSGIVRTLLLWLFPDTSEAGVTTAHVFVRKAAHFTEYAVLALLAARAFITSTRPWLSRRWFAFALLLVVLYALGDEFHQSFVPTRTGSIYDSLIDITGGFVALVCYGLKRRVGGGAEARL